MATSDVIPLGWRNWANLLAYVVNLGLTYSSLTGLFGETNTDLSAKYQTLVTPAGYAFPFGVPSSFGKVSLQSHRCFHNYDPIQ